MALTLRKGSFGNYWGNDFNSSNPLNNSKMKVNAEYIYKALSSDGWSLEAICGMLGNMQTESSINPGRWQNDRVGGEPKGHGYGLVQWTPYTKYTNWNPVKDDPSTMDNNLKRIGYEVNNDIQWIPTNKYPLSFEEFKVSNSSPYDLALAFLANYERPQEPNQPIRGSQALEWFKYLGGIIPPTPTITKNKQKFKWVLYAKKLRNINF